MNEFSNLLKHVNQPDLFITMVNAWMDKSHQTSACVETDVDQFLCGLMDEQREARSQVNEELLFDALSVWIKQATVEQRTAMIFNTEHMVGLSCLAQSDDLALLDGISLHDMFLTHSNSTDVSVMFLSRLITCADNAPKSLCYLLSSPAFAAIVRGGNQCELGGREVYIDSLDIESLMWRVFVSSKTTPQAQIIADLVRNVVLDNLNDIAVHGVLDVLASGNPNMRVSETFLTDPRFLQWTEKDACLARYCCKHSTIFPTTLNRHFPELVEVGVCNCAYILMEAAGLHVPRPSVETDLCGILQDHPQAVEIVRKTIERLDASAHPSLSNFPDSDIEMLLGALSDEHIQQWRDNPWEKDVHFSMPHYPRLVKSALTEQVGNSGLARKRMI